MAKRTKLQIQEEERILFENKTKIVTKLIAHLDEFNEISEENKTKIKDFIFMFFQCEEVYKKLYSEMEILEGKPIDVRNLKINVQRIEKSLRYFGIPYEHDDIMKIFNSKKSYLTYRDTIVHGLKMQSINEVLENYAEIKAEMEEFLNNVRQFNFN